MNQQKERELEHLALDGLTLWDEAPDLKLGEIRAILSEIQPMTDSEWAIVAKRIKELDQIGG